jgi:hypothetical protein
MIFVALKIPTLILKTESLERSKDSNSQVEMEEDMKATLAALEDTLAEHRLEETEEGKQYR